MANTRSAEKRIRQTGRRTIRNRMVRSRFRTLIRRFRESIQGENAEEIRSAFSRAVSALDKAVQSGVIHKNTASRRKSRLARELVRLRDG